MSFILVATDIDGDEYEHDCLSYEELPGGWICLRLDGERIAMLEPRDVEGGFRAIERDEDADDFLAGVH